MSNLNLTTGPSSWDRDMQGLDVDDESENLAALGMHVAGKKEDDDEDEEEEESVEKLVAAVEPLEAAKEIEADEPEELDELEELDRLEKVLKDEDEPVMIGDDEE